MRRRTQIMKKRIIEGPKLISTSPANGAVGVAAGAVIILSFNKPVDVNGGALSRVAPPFSPTIVHSHPGGDLTKIQITPDFAMTAGADYQVYGPTPDVVGKARKANGVPFPFTFTIAP